MHSSCDLKGSGYKDGVPCSHLFKDGAYAWLFSQDEQFCCVSSVPSYACHLSAPQRDFFDVFDHGFYNLSGYTAEDGLYSGPVLVWTMHLTQPAGFWFWYVTDPDGRPLEQGEGPCEMYDGGLAAVDSLDGLSRGCSGPPKMLFHQYHAASFQEAKLDDSVFDVPQVCKDTKASCLVTPTNFCDGRRR